MRRFLFVGVILMTSIVVGAKSLVFTLANDTKVYYALDVPTDGLRFAPVVKFSQGSLSVNGDRYEWSGIKDFRLSDEGDPAGIMPHGVCVETDAPVSIYSADGKKVGDAESYASFQRFDLSHLPQGIYVVEIGGNVHGKVSFKLTKK